MSNYNKKAVYEEIYNKTGVVVDTEMLNLIDEWSCWYDGDVDGFHNYTEIVMGVHKNFTRKTLKPGARTANAWCEILTREFPEIAIEDARVAERVQEILIEQNFKEELVKYLELGFGEGTSLLVEYIVDDKPQIDFLRYQDFVPLSWKNGVTHEIATINTFVREGKYYTHIQYNLSRDGNYVIENSVYVSDDSGDLGSKIDPAFIGLEEMEVFKGIEPWFQIIRPNIINKEDPDSPYGQAIFGDAIDTLKCIDSKYTELDQEFCLGRKRIVVSGDALKKELVDGQWTSYLGSDSVYQAVRTDGEPLFESVDFSLREQSFINALNQEFSFLADSVGMDGGTFLYNGSSMKTATEVISEKSKTFGSKKKHDKMLKNVITKCVQSIIQALSEIDNVDYNDSVEVTMSDNVLIDDQAKKIDERLDVQSGNMPKVIFLMRNYGLTEDEAKSWVVMMNEESGQVTSESIEGMFKP